VAAACDGEVAPVLAELFVFTAWLVVLVPAGEQAATPDSAAINMPTNILLINFPYSFPSAHENLPPKPFSQCV
jgi:hypothetical protein